MVSLFTDPINLLKIVVVIAVSYLLGSLNIAIIVLILIVTNFLIHQLTRLHLRKFLIDDSSSGILYFY